MIIVTVVLCSFDKFSNTRLLILLECNSSVEPCKVFESGYIAKLCAKSRNRLFAWHLVDSSGGKEQSSILK